MPDPGSQPPPLIQEDPNKLSEYNGVGFGLWPGSGLALGWFRPLGIPPSSEWIWGGITNWMHPVPVPIVIMLLLACVGSHHHDACFRSDADAGCDGCLALVYHSLPSASEAVRAMLGLLKPIHEGIHKGWLRRPPPFVEAARSAASFMDGFVEAKEAAGAAQTHVNLGKTCTCMHILRATSDPQGHHGRAQRPGEQGFSNVFTNTKKTRSVRTIILPAVSRRDLCYASENEGFRFY